MGGSKKYWRKNLLICEKKWWVPRILGKKFAFLEKKFAGGYQKMLRKFSNDMFRKFSPDHPLIFSAFSVSSDNLPYRWKSHRWKYSSLKNYVKKCHFCWPTNFFKISPFRDFSPTKIFHLLRCHCTIWYNENKFIFLPKGKRYFICEVRRYSKEI